MLCNTTEYAVFFSVVFVVSWALARRLGGWARIGFLLAASYGFYAAWDIRYLPLIFGSSTVDFFLARRIAREESAARRKLWLVVTVALNLGFLGFFKYWAFAVENVAVLRALLEGAAVTPVEVMPLLPPVGISFFTFESMSYVIDVYRKETEPHPSYFRYLLFVSFFPHLVAGPIVRPRDLLPQLAAEPLLRPADGSEGLFLIALGLLKKVAIADYLATNLVERIFERPESYSSLEVLAGVYGYAVQIYCDFSGYSDIAIGSALLLGVRFPKNFDSPYQATNIAEFWHRWHISLSTWLRDYLYIPLGGSRGSSAKTYRNLLLTMLLGGLWHGASWNFVLWGFLHGLGLAVTRAYQRARGPLPEKVSPLRTVVSVLFTFHWVCLAWIFFRAPTWDLAVRVLARLTERSTFHPNLHGAVLFVLGLGLASHYLPERVFQRILGRFSALPAPAQGALLFLAAVLVHEVASTAAVPFVYFQF